VTKRNIAASDQAQEDESSNGLQRFLKDLGPGIITGAADEAGAGAHWLFTLGMIGTGMLAVPVLAGSCAYAVAEGARWKSASLNLKPRLARKFYGVIAVSIAVGLAVDFAHLNAVKMLFWSAILNGLLAPPLVVMVVLLTSDKKVMGNRTNSHGMKWLGWACALIMSAAAVGLIVSSI
jgi:Mn2+/Fe2+ NRAMP family transporter